MTVRPATASHDLASITETSPSKAWASSFQSQPTRMATTGAGPVLKTMQAKMKRCFCYYLLYLLLLFFHFHPTFFCHICRGPGAPVPGTGGHRKAFHQGPGSRHLAPRDPQLPALRQRLPTLRGLDGTPGGGLAFSRFHDVSHIFLSGFIDSLFAGTS